MTCKSGIRELQQENIERGPKMQLSDKRKGFYYSSPVYIHKTAAIDLLLGATDLVQYKG